MLNRLLLFALCLWSVTSFASELQIITSGGFQGVADEEGQVIIPAVYEKLGWSNGSNEIIGEAIGYFESGYWGLINIKSKKLTSAKYATLQPFDNHLFEAGITGKFSNQIFRGLIDKKSKVLLDFKYYTIQHIGNHRAIVSEYESGLLKYGLLTDEGDVLLPVNFGEIVPLGQLVLATAFNGKKRIYDQGGQIKLYPWIDQVTETAYGYLVSSEGYFGLLSESGLLVHDIRFKTIAEGEPVSFPEWEIRQVGEDSGQFFLSDSITYEAGEGLLIAHVNNVQHILAASKKLFNDQKNSLKYIGAGFLVSHNNVSQKWGIYKTDGREVAVGFDSVMVDSAYFYTKSQGRWDIYNLFGRKISEKAYLKLGPSHDGYIPFKVGEYWGWLDFQGHVAAKPKYEQVKAGYKQHYLAKNFGSWGIRDYFDHWLVMPQYDHIQLANGFYLAKKGAATHVYDQKGNRLFVTPYEMKPGNVLRIINGDQVGLVTPAGYYSPAEYQEVNGYGSYYELNSGNRASLIAGDGSVVFGEDKGVEDILSFAEGYFHIIQDGKHGFVDQDGNLRIANRYDSAQFFNEGLAPVKLLGKWGYIGPYENLIIQPFYQSSSTFENGLAIIQIDDLYGLINKGGEEIIQPKWKYIERLATGNYKVIDASGNVGIANAQGRFLVRPNYESITDTAKDLLIVNRAGQMGVLDYTGLTQIPFEYSEIKVVGDYVILRD